MKQLFKRPNILAIAMMFIFQAVFATDYYCDPVNGKNSNDGSKSNPWNTLESIFKDGKQFEAGDKIYLLTGDHGDVTITGENTKYIKIIGAQDHKPIVNSIVFGTDSAKASRWEISNVSISGTSKNELVFIHNNSSKIRLISNNIFCEDHTKSGVNIQGSICKFENNFIHDITTAFIVSGQKNQIRNNRIEFFSSNAIEISGDYNLLEYNLIKESINSKANNAVLITSNPIKGNILRGNTIINFVKPNRKEIGLMNGIYGENVNITESIFENNIVISNGENGIALSGEINNSKIVNNTVVNPYFGLEFNGSKKINTALAIKITGNENSNNVVIRNNLVNNFVFDKIIGLADHNLTLPVNVHDYDLCFKNWALFDFSLGENSKALNKGIAEFAPKSDANLNQRPIGNFVNIGAFEYTKINDANETFVIDAEITDRQIHSKGKADWDGQPKIRIGGSGEGIDGAGVFPFKLPLIPGGKEIISVNFTVYLDKIDNKPEGGIDLYGLPAKSNFWVTEDMFYQGTFGQDLKARPIQYNFVKPDAYTGETKLDAKGIVGLKNYINTIYETGSKAGDFVFLRLNPNAKDITDYHRWSFISANSEKEDKRPKLEITVGYPELNKPGIQIKDQLKTVVASANPIKNGELSLYFLGYDKNETINLTLFTYRGKEVLNSSIKISDLNNNVFRTEKLTLPTGKYILQFSSGEETKKQTVFVW
ncbi:MAG: right-handed parallel beta-helix repeat-containing protein [Bacteroidota bacterium]